TKCGRRLGAVLRRPCVDAPAIGREHRDVETGRPDRFALCVVGTHDEINARPADHAPPGQPNPNAALSLQILLREPEHALPPKTPMSITETLHLPMPGRIARKCQHTTIA